MNYIWLILIAVLLLIEFMSTTVVAVWFSISALVAFIVSLFVDNYIIEAIVFIVIGLILLIALRPVLNLKIKKFISKFKRVK